MKKEIKKFISGLTAAIIVTSMPLNVIADNSTSVSVNVVQLKDSGYTSEDSFTFDSDTGTITGYTGTDTVVNIPPTIGGVAVTGISNAAFRNCSCLTEITIPDSVTNIGSSAFNDCSSLTQITIPASVTGIGSHAFFDCNSLTSINVDENNSNYCDINGVLFNKDKTKLLQYPAGIVNTEYDIPDSVTGIGNYAFRNCSSLADITIPDSVTSIGSYAFTNCSSLNNITIPDSVTTIGSCAFYGCGSLTQITIPDSVTSIGDIPRGEIKSCRTALNLKGKGSN